MPVGTRWVGRLRSIRSKLAVGFFALVALVTANTALYSWGAAQRAEAFGRLQRGIERQTLLRDAQYRTEDQQRYFDLIGVLDAEAMAAVPADERARFAARFDTTTAMVGRVAQLTAPERRPLADSLRARTERLGEAWTAFLALQGRDAERALETLYVRADPLARQLIDADFPAAVEAQERLLADLSAGFLRTSRRSNLLTWLGLAVSALIGALLAFAISRDLLAAVESLRRGAEALGAGRRDTRVALDRRDELGDVSAAFDAMAARLDARTAEVEAQRDSLTAALTELRATQAQLVQREKLASLGELTAGIAHEIQNPLNFVTNFSAINAELSGDLREAVHEGDLGEALALADEIAANAIRVQHHGGRADGIVRAMLEHSRQRPGERAPTDVNALVEEHAALAWQAARPGEVPVDVALDLGADVGEVVLSPSEIGRVVVNLVGNAIDAVQERAAGASDGYAPAVTVRTRRVDGEVVVRVEDNGPGLAPGTEGRVFQPFYTTKPTGQGTGLGLSLSHDIVAGGHGGALVHVPSAEGAAFEVRLPADGRAAGSA